jgi:4-amino-4-deoxy-L-arabinose transferase-like glycosyltransferase
MNKITKPWLYRAESAAYLLFVVVYPFLFMRFGLDYTDGPYHYLGFSGLKPAGDSTFLYSWLGAAWTSLAGDHLISYRYLAATITLLTISLPILLICRKTEARLKLRYLAVGSVLTFSLSYYLVNWDLFANLFLALIMIAMWYYLKDAKWHWVALTGLLTALLTAIRMPGMLVIVPCVIVFASNGIVSGKQHQKWIWHTAIFLAVAISGYLGLKLWGSTVAFTGNSTGLNLSGAMAPLSNPESAYSFSNLVIRYIQSGFRILEMMGVMVMLVVAWHYRTTILKGKVLVILFILLIFASWYVVSVSRSIYNYQLSYFYSAFTLLLIALLIKKGAYPGSSTLIIFLVFALLVGPIAAAGSNTGLLKTGNAYLIIVPVLLVWMHQKLAPGWQRPFHLLLAVTIGLTLTGKLVLNDTYEDGKLWQLTATVNHPKLIGIHTTPLRKHQIEEITRFTDSVMRTEQSRNVLFYGSKAWLFRYLYNMPVPYRHPFWMAYDNPSQAKALTDYLVSNKDLEYIVLVFDYPENEDTLNGGLIEEALSKQDFTAMYEGLNYRIFRSCEASYEEKHHDHH